uniref:Uncharacterized protein n=1 Tax=Callorhinchus milii TaxID=7868 RepID=A0A4W3JAU7_CALMI
KIEIAAVFQFSGSRTMMILKLVLVCLFAEFFLAGANLTTSVERIKIVFTPTICKRNCKNGKCYNNCKKGNPTTLYSENGYGPVSKSGFRICK